MTNDLRTIVAEALHAVNHPGCQYGQPEIWDLNHADAVLARLEPLLRAAHWAINDRPHLVDVSSDLLAALNAWMAER